MRSDLSGIVEGTRDAYKYKYSCLFVSFMEKSIFTEERFQIAQRTQVEMSQFAVMFLHSNCEFHYQWDLGFTAARKLLYLCFVIAVGSF